MRPAINLLYVIRHTTSKYYPKNSTLVYSRACCFQRTGQRY